MPEETPGQSDPPVYAGTHESAKSGTYPCQEQSPNPPGASGSHPSSFGRKEGRPQADTAVLVCVLLNVCVCIPLALNTCEVSLPSSTL